MNLKSLILVNCGLGDDNFEELLQSLEYHKTQVEVLDISQNELTVHSMKKLALYLSAN